MTAPDFAPFPDDWTRALAVVAHPDDLEYGPSSAVAAWTGSGRRVTYCIVSSGEAGIEDLPPEKALRVRRAEQRAAAATVGVEDVVFLDHPDGRIQGGVGLRRDITRVIRRHTPDILVTINFHERWRSGDWNSADHRCVGHALLDAASDAGNRWTFPELAAQEGLEPWRGVRFVAAGGSPASGHAVDVADTLDAGVRSLAAHRSYLAALGPDHPMADAATVLREKAARFGTRFGGRPAMAFEVIGV